MSIGVPSEMASFATTVQDYLCMRFLVFGINDLARFRLGEAATSEETQNDQREQRRETDKRVDLADRCSLRGGEPGVGRKVLSQILPRYSMLK
jgi:hypothetical protein